MGSRPRIPADLSRLAIVSYPEPVLRKKCAAIEVFDGRLSDLVARMLELMKAARGVGLAAPQVGIPIRLFVYNLTGEPGDDGVCVNPELSEPDGAAEMEEGCLSIAGVDVPMRRAAAVTLRACDAAGRPWQTRAEDLLARVFQHETDHLDGRLIIDNMSEAVRIQNRRAIKLLEDEYEARRRRGG